MPAKKPVKKSTKPAAKTKSPAAKSVKKHGPRADFGKPIDSFFDKQPAELRSILVELRKLIEAAAPEARPSIKWGMPVYEIDGKMYAAIGAHKAHVNLILAGPPGAFKDTKGLLTGEAKTGRHLKLTKLAELPRTEVKSWLSTAAHLTRTK